MASRAPKKRPAAAPPASVPAPAAAGAAAPSTPASGWPPSAHLPTIKTVDAGVWYRVHTVDPVTGKYASTAFNDSGAGNARFSPLRRADGSVIPTLYAAASKRTAIAEILFHDAPTPSTGWTFPWSKHGDRSSNIYLSDVRVPALKLAALTTMGLQAAGLDVGQLLGGNHPEYTRTRAWALHLYEQMPGIQGLYWMSRRDNEFACVMLFGDRVSTLSELDTSHISGHERIVLETVLSLNASIS